MNWKAGRITTRSQSVPTRSHAFKFCGRFTLAPDFLLGPNLGFRDVPERSQEFSQTDEFWKIPELKNSTSRFRERALSYRWRGKSEYLKSHWTRNIESQKVTYLCSSWRLLKTSSRKVARKAAGIDQDHLIAESHKKHAKAIEYYVAAFNLERNFPGGTVLRRACLGTTVSESALVTQIACLTRERTW